MLFFLSTNSKKRTFHSSHVRFNYLYYYNSHFVNVKFFISHIFLLHFCNVDQSQFLNICILQNGDQCLGCINRSQYIDSCLDCASANHKSILRVLYSLWRCIDNQIDLVSKDQIHQVRRRLLQLVCTCYLDSVLSQDVCSTSCCKDTVSLSLETFCDRDDILFILILLILC